MVFEVDEFVGEHTDPRFDEVGDAPLEEKCESLGDAIEQAVEDAGATTEGDA